MPIDPKTPIPVTLEAEQWNRVMAVLSEAPYKAVADIISQITLQAQTIAGQIGKQPNGHIEADSEAE